MIEKKTAEPLENDNTVELRGDREVVVSWILHAPPRAVFDAWTQPELVRCWWAPKALGIEMVSSEGDVRIGGKYRYVMRTPGGELAFSGKYTEITSPSRLVYTHVFEPMAHAGELVVTVTFTEHAGSTRVVVHEIYPSKEVRAAAIAGGAESGRRETMKQLDELIT